MTDQLTHLRETFGFAGAVKPAEKKYDPSQPRYPEGDPRGGQWAADGGSSSATGAGSAVGFDTPFPGDMDETERKKNAAALTKALARPGWEYDSKETYGPGNLYRIKQEGEKKSQYRVFYDKYENTWKTKSSITYPTSLGGSSMGSEMPTRNTLLAALEAAEQNESNFWRQS